MRNSKRLPPEIKLYKNYDAFNQYSNVYTFAVLTYLLLPSNIYEKKSIIDNINYEIIKDNNYRFDFQATYSELFNKFMRFCLQPDPEKRKVTFKIILDTITDYKFYHRTYDFNIDTVLKYLNKFGNEFDYLKEKIIRQNK